MGLLLKHLQRSVRRSPWQPLLTVLTVLLAVAVSVTAFRLIGVFFERARSLSEDMKALGDVSLTASADREVGILLPEEAKDAVGERGQVFGELSMVGFISSNDGDSTPISVCAADLEAADRYFEFRFLEYGRFTVENLDSSAVISADLAEAYGCGVGDTVELTLLGETLFFRIEAVAKTEGLFSERDMLIGTGCATRILARQSAFIASLGDSFVPCNRILIKCATVEDAAAIADELRSRAEFADCIVEERAGKRSEDAFATFESVSIILLMLLVLVLSCILIITSQTLMRRQRALEYAQFCAAGASKRMLFGFQLAESMIYSGIGAVVGIGISPYLLRYAIGLFGWERYAVNVGFGGILFGFLLACLLSLSATLIAERREKCAETVLALGDNASPAAVRKMGSGGLFSGILLFLSVTVAFFLPTEYRIWALAPAVILLIVFLYQIFLLLYRGCARLFTALLERGRRTSACLLPALKLSKNDDGLCQFGRVVCVLMSLLIAIFSCLGVLVGQERELSRMLGGDVMTLNLSKALSEQLEKDERIEGIMKVGIDKHAVLNGRYSVLVVYTAGEGGGISRDLVPAAKGNGVILSHGVIDLCGLEIGDGLVLNVNGIDYPVTVAGVHTAAMCAVYVDAELISDRAMMHSVKFKEGLTQESAEYQALLSYLEAEGVLLTESSSVIGSLTETLVGFIALSRISLLISVFIASVGCCNLLVTGYRVCRHQREILMLCGADRKRVRRIGAISIAIILAFALLLGIAGGALTVTMLDAGVRSFGFALI